MSDWNVDDAGVAAKAAADARSEIDALRAANRDLQDWYESTKAELEKARARVAELERDVEELEYLDAEAAVGAELAADEIMRLKAKLEELEALQAPVILRKQAEAVEQCWTDIAEMVFSTDVRTPQGALNQAARHCADYALRLRQQAEAAGRAGR